MLAPGICETIPRKVTSLEPREISPLSLSLPFLRLRPSVWAVRPWAHCRKAQGRRLRTSFAHPRWVPHFSSRLRSWPTVFSTKLRKLQRERSWRKWTKMIRGL